MKYKKIYEGGTEEITRERTLFLLKKGYKNADEILNLMEKGKLKGVRILGGFIEIVK